jgi:hypothetical protein
VDFKLVYESVRIVYTPLASHDGSLSISFSKIDH